ncbi:MAG TPA: PAS domain S-box protein [Alphaproteobacteria bacterium]|nr:PAS domain S-box protein [Alphaproteobacteria bacterium]
MAGRIFTAKEERRRAFDRTEILAAARGAYFSFAFASATLETNEDFAEKLGFLFGGETNAQNVFARVHPEDKSSVDALLADLEECELGSGEVEFRVLGIDGEYHWLRLRASCLPQHLAQEPRIIGSLSNVDAAKRQEAAIELGAQRQDDLLRQIEVMRAQLSYVLEVVESQRVWIWDQETGVGGFLHGLAELLGIKPAFLATLDAFQARVHAEDWRAVSQGLDRLWQEQSRPVSIDYRVRSHDGSWQWVRTRGGLWRRGEFSGLVCAGTHAIVTVERSAREQRDREIALFTAFLESAPAAVAMFDNDMRYIYASQRWCEDFGLDGQILIGQSHYDIFSDVPEEWKEVHRRCLAGGTELRELDRFERADGSKQYLRWIARPWHLSDGSIGGIIIVSEELTDRQRRAVEIAEDQERLRAALAIADAAVWELDIVTQRFYCSERLAELAGRDNVDSAWARDFISSLHPDDVAHFLAVSRRFWSGETDRVAVDVRVQRKEGGYRWLRSYIGVVSTEDGRPRRLIGFLKDIGSLKEAELAARDAEERALAANAAKSQFLATMSHEIRTPMNGVLGMASALESAGLNADQRAMLAIIQSSGEDLLALLNDLLDMSKAESDAIELNEVAFSLTDLMSKTAALFSESALAKRISLHVEIAPRAQVFMKGDAMRIRQVLNNLISNAVKFTEAGAVTVSAERVSEAGGAAQAVIKVADTGIGIAADQLGRVFEPFVQLDSGTQRRYEGTGLGLSICRRLVERMRGSIAVCSQPGKGSVFTVILPLAEACSETKSPAAAQPRVRSHLGPLRILVAEDNHKNQIVIEKILSATGAQLFFADDGRQAFERWQENTIDLVLMDVRMPVADGIWAAREIRLHEQRDGRTRTPIIALSADATAQGVLEALGAGMDAHIAKPIQVRPLLETIAAVVRP